MNGSLLLDGLLALLVLLFAAIGCWRGVAREAFVTAGVLAGAALAAAWARPWGADLADLIGLRVAVAQVIVAMAALLGSTVLLGYGGSIVALSEPPGPASRVFGGALGAMNGLLLIAYVLGAIERFLADEATTRRIEESVAADTLVHELGWVLLALAAAAGLSILAVSPGRQRRAMRSVPEAGRAGGAEVRPSRAPRLVWGRDDDKVEPASRGFDPESSRFGADAPDFRQTVAIPTVNPQQMAGDRRERHVDFSGGEWFERAAALRGSGAAEPTAQSRRWDASGGQRCPSCGEVTAPHEAYCPRCGRALGFARS